MRVAIYDNRGNSKRFGKAIIRHRGTCQRLYWVGPLFVVVRNAASTAAIRSHANNNDGSM